MVNSASFSHAGILGGTSSQEDEINWVLQVRCLWLELELSLLSSLHCVLGVMECKVASECVELVLWWWFWTISLKKNKGSFIIHHFHYWHLNIQLIREKIACQSFSSHLGLRKKNHFQSVTQWCELGKTQTGTFCQQNRLFTGIRKPNLII